jgi:hypothetical protein
VSRWHAEFLQHWNDLAPGHRVMAYCNPSWGEAGNTAGLDRWHLFIANYEVPRPAVPGPWKTWTAWQKSGTTLDRDEFNGGQAALLNFCRMPEWRR